MRAGVESVDARHRVQQSHVLGAVERQTLSAVMVHHLWDAGEHAAALVQGVAVVFGLGDDDMNAALTRPESHRGEETGIKPRNMINSHILVCFMSMMKTGFLCQNKTRILFCMIFHYGTSHNKLWRPCLV